MHVFQYATFYANICVLLYCYYTVLRVVQYSVLRVLHYSTTDLSAFWEVDKWTRTNFFGCFLLSAAFLIEYKVVFISEYLTAFFYALSSITWSTLLKERSHHFSTFWYCRFGASGIDFHVGSKLCCTDSAVDFTEEPCLILIGSQNSLECTDSYVDSV
jgi:hypothetical protein